MPSLPVDPAPRTPRVAPRARPRAPRRVDAPLPRAGHPGPLGGRAGFSLVETVIILVILGLVAAYAVPALSTGTDAKAVKGGANVIAAQLANARTTAILRSRCATVHLATNMVWTTTETCGGTPIDTVTRRSLATAYGVVAQGCAGTYCDPGNAVDYQFDPRGIPYSGQPGTWVVSRNAATDTVEVGLMGVISQ